MDASDASAIVAGTAGKEVRSFVCVHELIHIRYPHPPPFPSLSSFSCLFYSFANPNAALLAFTCFIYSQVFDRLKKQAAGNEAAALQFSSNVSIWGAATGFGAGNNLITRVLHSFSGTPRSSVLLSLSFSRARSLSLSRVPHASHFFLVLMAGLLTLSSFLVGDFFVCVFFCS